MIRSSEDIKYPDFGGFITSPNFYNRAGSFDPDGLFSEQIFGPVSSYRCSCGFLRNRILDEGKTCPRCNVKCIDNISRLKTYGKIKLICPIIKLTKKNKFIKLIGKKNQQLLDPKQADANAALNRFLGIKKDKSEIIVVSSISDIPSDFKLIPFKITGLYSLIYILRFLADILKVEEIKNLFTNKYIVDELEILPPDIRPIFPDPSNPNVLRYDMINKFYVSIINSNKRNQLLYPALQDELKKWTSIIKEKLKTDDSDPYSDLEIISYDQIAAFYQFYADETFQWCLDKVRGKEGLIRSNMLSRTLEFSGRTVVAVNPKLRTYEVEVPREMLFTLWMPYFLNYLVNYRSYRYDELYTRLIEKKYQEIREKDPEMHQTFIEFLEWFSNLEE